MRVAVEEEEAAEGEQEEDFTKVDELKQIPFKSMENEMKAWKLLDNLITDRLKEYPTDIA